MEVFSKFFKSSSSAISVSILDPPAKSGAVPLLLNSSYLSPVHSLLPATPDRLVPPLLTCTSLLCVLQRKPPALVISDPKDWHYTSKLGEHFGRGGQTIVATDPHSSGLPSPAPLPSQAAVVVGHWTASMVTVGDP